MIEFIFDRLLPIIGFILSITLFIVFWPARSLLDKETIRLVKQVKSMWGQNFGTKSGEVRASSAQYKSATTKIGKHIKGMVPFGLLDDLNDEEVHSYIMHPDTINFFIKLRDLTGGEWKLAGELR